MWVKFGTSAKRVIKRAYDEAKARGCGEVTPEHLLIGLLGEKKSPVLEILRRLDVNFDKLLPEAAKASPVGSGWTGDMTWSNTAKKVLEASYIEASMFRHTFIGAEHLLLGILRSGVSPAYEVLKNYGVTYQSAKFAMLGMIRDLTESGVAGVAGPDLQALQHLMPSRAPAPEGDQLIRMKMPVSDESMALLDFATDVAQRLGRDIVEPEHLLLGMILLWESDVHAFLSDHGITYESAREFFEKKKPPEEKEDPEKPSGAE